MYLRQYDIVYIIYGMSCISGTELCSRRAPPEVFSPQWSFTAKFEMDWRVASTPKAPEYSLILQDINYLCIS
jgi:hypothetical protein